MKKNSRTKTEDVFAEDFKDINGVQICRRDEVHFVIDDRIYEGTVDKVEGRYCHLHFRRYGNDNFTKIMHHNCAFRVIIVKGEMLDQKLRDEENKINS